MQTPDSDIPITIERLFHQAAAIDSEMARRKFIRKQCGDNFLLEQQVLERLRRQVHDDADEERHNGETTVDQSNRSLAGESIGPYQLVELIGEGGFGQVYVAEQREPVKRRVALKLLRPGMGGGQVAARFNVERKALALMNHPHIAKVLDGGNSTDGQPYFVMELVNGCSITQFCDQHQLAVDARLKIFADVCDAVEHAHKKGIIHRDLKPSNVLVAIENGKYVPKVIDFGVAKALNRPLTDDSIHTGFAQMIGTPLYMSPEQAGLNLLDADTRSDVYSLGTLLYELLTGETPLAQHAVKNVPYDQVRKLVREAEATKPSARIHESTLTMVHAARNRDCHPERLYRQVQGDLDWIVLKAVEKDRERRYQSASALAEDVRRFLRHEPIEARPPSTVYLISKFVRKHRVFCTAAAVVVATMIGATAFSSWQAYRATQSAIAEQKAKVQEEAQRKIAERKADEAEQARQQEERKRKLAEGIRDTFVYVLRSPHPEVDGRMITVYELLQNAQLEIERSFADDPITKAHLLVTIGSTLLGLELEQQAAPLFQQAVEIFTDGQATRKDLLRSRVYLCTSLIETADLNLLYKQASEDVDACQQELGVGDPVAIQANMNLSRVLQQQGKLNEAVELSKKVVINASQMLGLDHPQTLRSASHLAFLYLENGDLQMGLDLLESVALEKTQLSGESSFSAIVANTNLAKAHLQLGQFGRAAAIAERYQNIVDEEFGVESPVQLDGTFHIGENCRRAQGLWRCVNHLRRDLKTFGGVPRSRPFEDAPTARSGRLCAPRIRKS